MPSGSVYTDNSQFDGLICLTSKVTPPKASVVALANHFKDWFGGGAFSPSSVFKLNVTVGR